MGGESPQEKSFPAPQSEAPQLPPPAPSQPQGWVPGPPLYTRIGLVDVVTYALMFIGAGVMFFIAWLNRDEENAFLSYGNLFWWLTVGAGLALMFGSALRFAIQGFRGAIFDAFPTQLVLSIGLLAFGVGGLFDSGLILPVLLSGMALVLPLMIWRSNGGLVFAITVFLVFLGAGVITILAWISRDVKGAFLTDNTRWASLLVWIGIALIVDFVLRLVTRGFRHLRSSSLWSLVAGIVTLALGVGLVDLYLAIPVLLFSAAVLVPLLVWTILRDLVSVLTASLFFVIAAVIAFLTWVTGDATDAFLTRDDLDLALGIWLEIILLVDIALGVIFLGRLARITLRLALFFFIAAAGAGIKKDPYLFLPVLLIGFGVVLLIWRVSAPLETRLARLFGRLTSESPATTSKP